MRFGNTHSVRPADLTLWIACSLARRRLVDVNGFQKQLFTYRSFHVPSLLGYSAYKTIADAARDDSASKALYAIEKTIRSHPPAKRRAMRQEKSKPLLRRPPVAETTAQTSRG